MFFLQQKKRTIELGISACIAVVDGRSRKSSQGSILVESPISCMGSWNPAYLIDASHSFSEAICRQASLVVK